jgi:hypothetical protein
MTESVFQKFNVKSWPHRFNGTLLVGTIAGGTPTDQNVAEGWLRTKLGAKDDLLREMVAETMAERGVTADEAAKIVDAQKHLNGFKRDENGLFIEGRQLKAALKEAASVAVAAGKLEMRGWGKTNKGLLSFLAEHVHVIEDKLHLGVTEASGITQRFVHTFRGTGIQYEEYVTDAKIAFTVETDYKFTDEQWAHIWLTGERQGIGASRSQGFGKYTVTSWDKA